MISFENLILITILSPLIVCFLTPFLSSKPVLRDILGPMGGIISSWGAIQLMGSILNGNQPRIELLQIAEGISISFVVTPLGAIFGLVASFLWIFAAISVSYTHLTLPTNREV